MRLLCDEMVKGLYHGLKYDSKDAGVYLMELSHLSGRVLYKRDWHDIAKEIEEYDESMMKAEDWREIYWLNPATMKWSPRKVEE